MKKKIALIGNMNNNMFPIARYLKDKDYQVTIFLFGNEFKHFHFTSDTFEDIQIDVIKTKLVVGPSCFNEVTKDYVRELFNDFNFCIGSGVAPAYFYWIKKELDLFIPYGSDIYKIPFYNYKINKDVKKIVKSIKYRYFQKKGIQSSKGILMDYTNHSYELLFKKLSIERKREYSNSPFIYTEEFSPSKIVNLYQKSSLYKQFQRIRDENEFVVFHHSRHEWQESEDILVTPAKHTKGNQKLIKAFDRIVKSYPNKSFHLVLFEYGADVDKSKQLIELLGIDKNVTWFPLSPRKEIMVGISLCDIGVGELDSSYFSYGAIYEFLAMAKPVIHFRDERLYKDFYDTMYPMYSANTTDQIYQILERLVMGKGYFEEVGIRAHLWFLENAIEKPLKFIVEKIEEECSISNG